MAQLTQSTRLDAREVHFFINGVNTYNLERLRARVARGKWHWLFPDSWEHTPENCTTLFHAINSFLLKKRI